MDEQTTNWRPAILRFFRYDHLPTHLQAASAPFGALAERIVANVKQAPGCVEQAIMALEHLLIAKDAAVRSILD